MRFDTLTTLAGIVVEMFDKYVAPAAKSMMSGEVPSAMLTVHRTGTKDKDWLAFVQFKDAMPISTIRCSVYLEDIFRLCRRNRLYLITDEVFRIAALYAMIHPLYQSQYSDFTKDLMLDYDSMMAGAGDETYRFIRRYYTFNPDGLGLIALDLFRYHMMIFSNHTTRGDIKKKFKNRCADYENWMISRYPDAYRAARFRKAQNCQIDTDGFIRLERLTEQEEH